MAHPLLVSLRPQSIIIAYHSHSHSHSHSHIELKLNSSSPRVLSLVRAVPPLQASASHSHLLDDLHHTPSPPSNKDDSGSFHFLLYLFFSQIVTVIVVVVLLLIWFWSWNIIFSNFNRFCYLKLKNNVEMHKFQSALIIFLIFINIYGHRHCHRYWN